MRAWGLAKGMQAHGFQVTVGINDAFPQKLTAHEGVQLTNWSLNQHFVDLINSYDAVVISYCMGDPSVFVADHINPDIQLILDVYVPIYVEVSARESDDIEAEYRYYMADIKRFNHVLKRGDYFLCAHDAQKTFYTGVLSALGIVNPRSYRQNRILVVPFGIHDEPVTPSYNPYTKLGLSESDFVALWFGGLYPWFRVEEFLDAILELSKTKQIKFVIVGGKNPFNTNADFIKQYEKARAFAKKHDLTNKSLFFVDWVDFEDRINWYAHADLVISINQPGEENSFSWRTRVMDYVWGEMAVVTNGGDPLSEELLAANAGIRLPDLTSQAIASTVRDLYQDPTQLQEIKNNVRGLKPKYFWPHAVQPVVDAINIGSVPSVEEQTFRGKLRDFITDVPNPLRSGSLNKVRRVASFPPRAFSYARRKGFRSSAQLAKTILTTQVKKRSNRTERQYVFISHPIDNTGAPQVLVQIVEEYAKKYGAQNVRLIAPHVLPSLLRKLREEGIRVEKAAAVFGPRLLDLQLGLRKHDFVLMNTVAIYDNYRHFVLDQVASGKVKHAYWFIHEDKAQLAAINGGDLLHKGQLKRMKRLSNERRLTVLVPSERTKREYNSLIGTKYVKAIPLRIEVDKKYYFSRTPSDYQKIDFLLQGTPADGRKGHFIALAAFYEFLKIYYEKDPKKYRNFGVHFVSIGDDYVSQQIRAVGRSLLGQRLKLYPSMPKEKVLQVYAKCNAVVCCSLNETFGLYIAEGMFMGHVVLRNNSAGVDEQLQDGKNGYAISNDNVRQIANTIEKLLNKKTTSNERLQKMGATSQQMIYPFTQNSYLEAIESPRPKKIGY